jgi:hypothetical protein
MRLDSGAWTRSLDREQGAAGGSSSQILFWSERKKKAPGKTGGQHSSEVIRRGF